MRLITRIDFWVLGWSGSFPRLAKVWAWWRTREKKNCRSCAELLLTRHYHFCGREDRRIGDKGPGKIEPPKWCPRRDSIKAERRANDSLNK